MELNFEQVNGWWMCRLTAYSSGQVVQLTLGKREPVMVAISIPGMEPMHLDTVQNLNGNSVMLELAVPEGLEICIKTRSDVVAAMIV